MQYFAYGSNVNTAALQDWCRKSGFRDTRFSILGPATLHDHALAFNRRSIGWGGGVLSIVSKRGSAVPGLLYEVNHAGATALDSKEGVTVSAYARYHIHVETQPGVFARATTYHSLVEDSAAFHRPTDAYLDTVLIGLSYHNLPGVGAVLAAAQGLDRACSVDGLIVYGTLRSGQVRDASLRPFAKDRLRCTLPGRLADMGEWPVYLCAADHAQTVTAELVETDDISEMLALCDRIEGYQGPEARDNLFLRGLAEVTLANGATRQGWIYRMPMHHQIHLYPLVPFGDWCLAHPM